MRPYDRLEIYDNDLGFRCLFVWEQRVVFLFRCAFSVFFFLSVRLVLSAASKPIILPLLLLLIEFFRWHFKALHSTYSGRSFLVIGVRKFNRQLLYEAGSNLCMNRVVIITRTKLFERFTFTLQTNGSSSLLTIFSHFANLHNKAIQLPVYLVGYRRVPNALRLQ